MIYVISGSCIFSGTLRNAKLIICILNTPIFVHSFGEATKFFLLNVQISQKRAFWTATNGNAISATVSVSHSFPQYFVPKLDLAGRQSEVDGRLFWAVSAKCSTYVWLEVPGPPIAAYAGPLGRRGHGLLACLLRSRGHFRTLGETSSLSWRYDPCTELIGVHCQLLSFAFLSDWSYFGPVCAGTFCSFKFFANVSFCHVTLVNREISKSWKYVENMLKFTQ